MNESEWVQFLKKKFPFGFGEGIGDDTSIVKIGDIYQLISKDLFIENVHFSLKYYTLAEVALKSLAVNLSDIAAMGGIPQYFYLGIGFPRHMQISQLTEFFEALKLGCKTWNVQLAGGDFSSSSELAISITIVGESRNPVKRGGARAGDLIGITGCTGESALGLALLKKGITSGASVKKHKTPQPELAAGLVLADHVNAMIDVSDGLLMDLDRILIASGKGAEIKYENIPVSDEFKAGCLTNSLSEHRLVLSGGEDYVLLFTISPEMERVLAGKEISYQIIGKILDAAGSLVVRDKSKSIKITDFGYDHFAS